MSVPDSLGSPVHSASKKAGQVLLVSHNFPPLQGAESLLVRNNALDLHARGWHLGVLTAPQGLSRSREDPGLLEGVPGDIEIIRTSGSGGLHRPGMGRLARYLIGRVETRWLPCPNLFWQKQAVALGLAWLEAHPDAVIYSRAPRHVSSLAAMALKKRSGRPWVAHFSDPWWDFSYEGTIHRAWIRRLEHQIIREADAVVFPNCPLADKVMAKYPDSWAGKIRVIPHGFATFPSPIQAVRPAGQSPLRVLHTGAFYPVYRTPDSLFEGLALLNRRMPLKGRLLLECVGDETVCFQPLVNKLGLEEIIYLREAVPYAECQEKIAQADLLAVVDVTYGLRGVFLPTKLIEYFAFLKPVIGIAPPGSAVAQTLQRCGLECPDQDSPEAIADAFERQILAWESGTFGVSQASRSQMAGYHLQAVNQPLHELLASLAG